MAFNVVPAGKVAWTYEEGENGLTSGAGAVVLTVAGDENALPGTENGAAKVTPLEMYPTKGRATGGVRSQRFLKGQNTLILAWVGPYPLHASTSAGSPVELPKPDMRRDGSGVDLRIPHRVSSHQECLSQMRRVHRFWFRLINIFQSSTQK